MLALQRGKCKLYELYAAHFDRSSGRWVAGSGAVFNLNRAGPLRHDGWTSADAAGLPILPGLVRYGEVKHGAIHHAIRVTFDETREAYIHPATHYASSSCDRVPSADGPADQAEGRLRHLAVQRPGEGDRRGDEELRVINADNGSSWYISGASRSAGTTTSSTS